MKFKKNIKNSIQNMEDENEDFEFIDLDADEVNDVDRFDTADAVHNNPVQNEEDISFYEPEPAGKMKYLDETGELELLNLDATGEIGFSQDEENFDVNEFDVNEFDVDEFDVDDFDTDDFRDESEEEEQAVAAAVKKPKHAAKTAAGLSFTERVNRFFSNLFANFTKLDGLIYGTGVVILAAILVVVGIWVRRVDGPDQSETLAQTGRQLADIGVLGQSGLVAVADAELARQQAMVVPTQEPEEEVFEEEETIEVRVSFTSVEKDLKIKFINNETGKLVNNAEFTVILTDSSGKSVTYTDQDMDGIIYNATMTPGRYSVEIQAPEHYEIISYDTTVTVRDTIVYEQIDVVDEVKTEAEVDTATEDTQGNIALEEEVVTGDLADTVEWVESTRTTVGNESGYAEIPKSSVSDPSLSASRAFYAGAVVCLADMDTVPMAASIAEPGEAGANSSTPTDTPTEQATPSPTEQATPTPTEQATPTPSPSEQATPTPTEQVTPTAPQFEIEFNNMEVRVGEVKPISVSVTSGSSDGLTWKYENASENVAVIDSNGNVTGRTTGTTKIKVTAFYQDSQVASGECTVTVKEMDLLISIDRQEGSVTEGNKLLLIATVTRNGVSAASNATGNLVVWTSSDTTIATVDEKGQVTGIKPGKVTITATTVDTTDGKEKTSTNVKTVTCTVTVTADLTNDTTSKLSDTSGNQVYVRNESGQYVEATYADYYSAAAFYIKSTVQYRYTGWQTIDNKTYYFDKNGNYVTGEQVIQGVRYNFDSQGVLSMGDGTLGIDVSSHNGTINWTAVRNAGVSYVIIRCGYRGSTQGALIEDSRFRQNIEGANAAGLKVGVYFYTQAVNEREAIEEASMVLSLVRNYKISYPIFIDTEASGGRADRIDRATRTAVCRAFCETIRNGGYTAGVYACKSWFMDKLEVSSLNSYKIWLAQYATTPTYTGRYDLWQRTDKGTISGISTAVDLNYSYLGY